MDRYEYSPVLMVHLKLTGLHLFWSEVDPIVWTTKRPKEMKLLRRRVAHARPKEREKGKETALPPSPYWANE